MREIKRGAIFYADLGETIGSEQSGYRPVLIIQNDANNKTSPTTIIAPISTKKNKYLKSHLLIEDVDKIKDNSIILFEQIRTVDKSRLRNFIGFIDKKQLKMIDERLLKILDIKLERWNF